MSELNIFTLLVMTFLIGTIEMVLLKKVSGTIVNAATAYWLAWISLLSASYYAINQEWFLEPSSDTLNYLMQLHFGAFIGFFIGSLLCKRNKRPNQYNLLVEKANFIVSKMTSKFLLILFAVGMIFFVEKLLKLGFTSTYLTDARVEYSDRSYSIMQQLGSHLMVIVGFGIIMLGVKDSKYGVNIKMLIIATLASAPLSLASGGRTFLLTYFINYMFSLLLCRGAWGTKVFLLSKTEFIKIISLLVILIFVFAIMGFIRGGYGDELDLLYSILSWPTSTIGAMDSWVYSALSSSSTNGLNTLGWFADILDRVGIVNFSEEQRTIRSMLTEFIIRNDRAAHIPRSILPDLILDFGEYGPFLGMLFLASLLQFITLKFSGRGVFFHTLATYSLIGAGFTVQQSVFGPSFAASLFWALVLTFFLNKKLNKTRYEN